MAKDGFGEGKALRPTKAGTINVVARLALIIKVFGINQNNLLKAMGLPVGGHGGIVLSRDHAVVLLAVAIPDQYGQDVRDLGESGAEVIEGTHDVRLTQATIANGDGEEGARVEQGRCHRKVLPLPQGASGRKNARNSA